MNKTLTTGQLAKILGVTTLTALRIVQKGAVPSFMLPCSTHHRINVDDLRVAWKDDPILIERLEAFLQIVPDRCTGSMQQNDVVDCNPTVTA